MTDSLTITETCHCSASTSVTVPITYIRAAEEAVSSWRSGHQCGQGAPPLARVDPAEDPEFNLGTITAIDRTARRMQAQAAWEAREGTITPMRGDELARIVGVSPGRARALIAEWRRLHVVTADG